MQPPYVHVEGMPLALYGLNGKYIKQGSNYCLKEHTLFGIIPIVAVKIYQREDQQWVLEHDGDYIFKPTLARNDTLVGDWNMFRVSLEPSDFPMWFVSGLVVLISCALFHSLYLFTRTIFFCLVADSN